MGSIPAWWDPDLEKRKGVATKQPEDVAGKRTTIVKTMRERENAFTDLFRWSQFEDSFVAVREARFFEKMTTLVAKFTVLRLQFSYLPRAAYFVNLSIPFWR